MRESDLVRDVLLAFGAHPDLVIWRSNTGAARTPTGRLVHFNAPGMPDITGVARGGRAVFVECKSDTGKLRPEQARFRDAVLALGAVWVLARSVEDVRAALRAAGIAA